MRHYCIENNKCLLARTIIVPIEWVYEKFNFSDRSLSLAEKLN